MEAKLIFGKIAQGWHNLTTSSWVDASLNPRVERVQFSWSKKILNDGGIILDEAGGGNSSWMEYSDNTGVLYRMHFILTRGGGVMREVAQLNMFQDHDRQG